MDYRSWSILEHLRHHVPILRLAPQFPTIALLRTIHPVLRFITQKGGTKEACH